MYIELISDNCVKIIVERNIYTPDEEAETLYYLGFGDADLETRRIRFEKIDNITPEKIIKEFKKQFDLKYKEATKGDLANATELEALSRVKNLKFNFKLNSFEENIINEILKDLRDDEDDLNELLRAIDESDESYNRRVKELNSETVKHPNHYMGLNNLEVIEVIRDFELNYNLGNVVKYVLRAGKKGNKEEDLRKAIQYLKFELGNYEDTRNAKETN